MNSNGGTLKLYPCDRGGGVRGWHHFEANPNGIIVCRYCGKKLKATS